MDSDIRKILKDSDLMKETFRRLEARKTFTAGQRKAIADAANAFRWLCAVQLSLLRAAFDADYAAELKRFNIKAKTKG